DGPTNPRLPHFYSPQKKKRQTNPPQPPPIKKSAPRLIPPKKKPIEKLPVAEKEVKQPKTPKEKTHAKQEMMQFEPVTRGRFEKSEPTIVEGQDLDVPTFLRKNIKVK